jgi:hypothetical protein
MKRLLTALTELLEAKGELLREEAAMLHMGVYARGYKDAQDDSSDVEYVFMDDSDEDD